MTSLQEPLQSGDGHAARRRHRAHHALNAASPDKRQTTRLRFRGVATRNSVNNEATKPGLE